MARAVEANDTLESLLYASNHLAADVVTGMEISMERTKRSVREIVGQVGCLFVWVGIRNMFRKKSTMAKIQTRRDMQSIGEAPHLPRATSRKRDLNVEWVNKVVEGGAKKGGRPWLVCVCRLAFNLLTAGTPHLT